MRSQGATLAGMHIDAVKLVKAWGACLKQAIAVKDFGFAGTDWTPANFFPVAHAQWHLAANVIDLVSVAVDKMGFYVALLVWGELS